MRVAALYDIHGNAPALEAVLAEVARVEVDLFVIGGDVAAGPLPRESLDLLYALGERAVWVRGNADRWDDALARRDEWRAGQALSRAEIEYFGALPLTAVFEVDGLGSTLFCHATPRSDEEIVTRITPEERLSEVLANVEEETIVCGHTHVQYDRRVGSRRVVNAGSVGMPYEARPGAYWALLGPGVEHRRTEYDLEAAAERIRATGLPPSEEFIRDNLLTVPTAEEATAHFEQLAAESQPDL